MPFLSARTTQVLRLSPSSMALLVEKHQGNELDGPQEFFNRIVVAGQYEFDEVVRPSKKHSMAEPMTDLPEFSAKPLEPDSGRQGSPGLQEIQEC